jgi:hypothetical protein
MNKRKEPTDSSRGPQDQNNNPSIQQKPTAGNKHSELPVPTSSALVGELESELNTTMLRDANLGIRPGETVSGTLHARNAGAHWRFLDEDFNFIEPGSSYHGEFIARAVNISGEVAYLALIAWRPVFGKRQEYARFARFSRRSFEAIRLWDAMVPKLGLKVGGLVEFVAKVTVYKDFVNFQIPTTRLKLLQPKSPKGGAK